MMVVSTSHGIPKIICLFLSAFSCYSSRIISSNNYTQACNEKLELSNGWVVSYPVNGAIETLNPGVILKNNCNPGYKLIGPTQQICSESGTWEPDIKTKCIKVTVKCKIPKVANGAFLSHFQMYSVGEETQIKCNNGKYVYLVCGSDGAWTYLDKREYTYLTACPKIRCRPPPQIPNGEWLTYDTTDFHEGTKVTYQCFSGYKLVSDDNQYKAFLSCHNGRWNGKLPTCIRSIHCGRPADIEHGSWVTFAKTNGFSYDIGTTVRYRCVHGYKLLGESILECMSGQLWSHIAPQCIPYTDDSVYCEGPVRLPHGKCKCSGRDLTYCQPFMPGIKVTCACDSDYQLVGDTTLTCQADGSWTGQLPTCQLDTGDVPQASSSFHVSTLAIVVATACSILGVLLFVMVIVVFRRNKPRARLYPGSPPPPPYTRVHNNSISDHDRMALISCDARRFPLPSYEEATAAPAGRAAPPGQPSTDYRPLPPVPVALRGAFLPSSAPPQSEHRTPSIQEVYGSRDTVNVSMSDASTSITVETYDSAASNPSSTSRRVLTGSLHSTSTCSIVTEDAPLLDGNHGDGRSNQESDVIEEIKDEERT